MRQAFQPSSARRRAFWTLVFALAAPGAASATTHTTPTKTHATPGAKHATPAAAMQCPRGQFLWKSKNKCLDKAEAAKLGIYHGPIPQQDRPAAGTDDAAKGKPAPEQPAAETAPAPPPEAPAAPQQPASLTPPAMQPDAAPPPAAPAPAAAPSPYGDLPSDGFNKAK